MAADSLKRAAAELNVEIKIETNGSSGIDNLLNDEDIKRAKGIIIAAGKTVDKERLMANH